MVNLLEAACDVLVVPRKGDVDRNSRSKMLSTKR